MTLMVAYVRQRLPLAVFGPAIAGLALVSWWAAGAPMPGPTVARLITMTGLLVVFFRIWDDIEDRDADGRAHPDRILPRAPIAVFLIVQLAFGAAVVAALLSGGATLSAVAFAALTGAAYWAYHHARARLPVSLWSFALLLKYPAMVVIVAGATAPLRPGRLALAALIAYLGALAHEHKGVIA